MISAGSKRILGFDNDSLMWCHLALEMKNVKLALIIFHLFSEQIFLQEGNINCVQSVELVQARGLKLLWAATVQQHEQWGREQEAGKWATSPKCLFCPLLNGSKEKYQSAILSWSGAGFGVTTARWQGWSAVQAPVLWGTAQLRAHTGAGTSLVSSWCWFRAEV